MKLHLPKGLRTALLAVFALTATCYTAQAAPASYDYLLQEKQTPHVFGTVNEKNGINSIIIPELDMSQSWVMDFTVKSINGEACIDADNYSGGASILANVNVPYKSEQIKNGDVTKPKMEDHQFSIYFTPNGKIYSMSNNGKVLLGTDPKGMTWQGTGITPFQITLNWVVDEEGMGSLYYCGGSSVYIGEPDAQGNATIGTLTDNAFNFRTDRVAILDNINTVDNDEVLDTIKMMWTSSPTDDRVTTTMYSTLYSKGSGSDPAAWQITGVADLYTLKYGGADGYVDNTDNGAGAVKTMSNGEEVHFIGDTGVIYTKEDATYSNKTLADADKLAGGTTASVGFGAAENATLTVERTALADSVLNNSVGLRIVGEGEVVLKMNGGSGWDSGDTITNLNMESGSTLVMQADGNVTIELGTGDVTNANIIHRGAGGIFMFKSTSTTKPIVLDTIASESGGTLQISALSAVTAKKVSSQGELNLTSDVVATESVEAASLTVGSNANLTTKDLTINGNATIGSNYTKPGTSVVTTTGTVFVNGNIVVYGALDASRSDSVSAANVTTVNDGVILAKELIASSASTAGVTVSKVGGMLLDGNVIIGPDGIQANTLADTAAIKFAADSAAKVTTKSMSASTIYVEDTAVVSYATTDKLIAVSRTSLTATGKLTSGEINLTNNYKLAATELAASSIKAGDTEIAARTEGYSYASHQNISVTTDSVGNCIIAADTIDANSVTIGKDDQLLGATVTTVKGLSLGENAVVTDVTVNAGTETTLGNNVSLKNVTIASGKFINNDTVNLDNVTFNTTGTGTETTYGGSQGEAFAIANNVESVQITGTQNGEMTKVDKLVLNAEGLDFDNIATGGTEYSFISGEDLEYDYDASRDQLNIKSFVRAELVTTTDGNGNTIITIKGQEDKAGITAELSDTHNRTVAIAAMQEALEGAPSTFAARATTSTPLAEICEYVGHVNRYSNTDRQNVLSAASGASLAALADSQRRGIRDVQDNLRNRIIQMGGGTSAGLTTDWEYVGLQAWAQADGGLATTDGSGDEWGYDFDTTGATVGANLDLTANTVVGLSFSASYGEISVDSTDHAKGNNDAEYISFFARHQKERWVQMFIFTYGMNEMDMERNILGYSSNSKTKGESFSAYYELGYTLGIDYEYNHILQPLVSVTLTSASVDAFTEQGTIGDAGIQYNNNEYFYGQVAVGARYQGVLYQTVHERNAVVEARAMITSDFGDTTDEADVSFAGSSKFTVKGADSSGMGYKLGASISIPVEQYTTLYADVDYTTAPDYTGFRADIGVRYDF